MTQTNNILLFDQSRARPSMRALVHQLVNRMGNPINIDNWDSLPSSDPDRITMTEIHGALGSQNELWNEPDRDVCERIVHVSLLAMHAVHSKQYLDKDILVLCTKTQAAAERVRSRFEAKDIQKKG